MKNFCLKKLDVSKPNNTQIINVEFAFLKTYENNRKMSQ